LPDNGEEARQAAIAALHQSGMVTAVLPQR
jgi:hypothetical protein